MSKANKVSSKTHTKSQLNNYANQHNPTSKAYQANCQNHANQHNPNNHAYQGKQTSKTSKAKKHQLFNELMLFL